MTLRTAAVGLAKCPRRANRGGLLVDRSACWFGRWWWPTPTMGVEPSTEAQSEWGASLQITPMSVAIRCQCLFRQCSPMMALIDPSFAGVGGAQHVSGGGWISVCVSPSNLPGQPYLWIVGNRGGGMHCVSVEWAIEPVAAPCSAEFDPFSQSENSTPVRLNGLQMDTDEAIRKQFTQDGELTNGGIQGLSSPRT
jgi:hypothetical protein